MTSVACSGNQCRTNGLVRLGQRELRAVVEEPELVQECDSFLQFVVKYLSAETKRLGDGETLLYGYWITKFVRADEYLDAWELGLDGQGFVAGVTRAVRYWRDQRRVCARAESPFQPPRADQLLVVSDGVLEGAPVEAVRYPSLDDMSGWWITTDQYRGDRAGLRTEHCYHLSHLRPELSQYLALPFGFRFRAPVSEEFWFDPEVAAEPPV
jgi:hypothetical protein